MTNVLEKPTMDEQDRLRLFIRTTHKMRDSRYIQDITKHHRTMSAGFNENGEPMFSNPTYDWEDFCSFLTMFRKIAAAKNESIYLPKILKLVMRCSSEDVRDIWRDGIDQINAIIEGRFSAIQYAIGTPDGRKKYTGAQVLDVLINGLVFHDVPEKVNDLLWLGEVEMGCHIFMLNIEIIMPVLNTCIQLRNLAYRLELLPDDDFPPPDPEQT
jgi:hypothetical protein